MTSVALRTAVTVQGFCAPVPFQDVVDAVLVIVSYSAAPVVTAPTPYVNCTCEIVVPEDGCTFALTVTLSKFPGADGLFATAVMVGAAWSNAD